jgi:hypothetical protein
MSETDGIGAPMTFDRLDGREVVLTPRAWTDADGSRAPDPLTVLRYLPTRGRRMVGAWCFVDYYGPNDVSGADGMRVPPHPHCGLQTVSWLLEGEIEHRDSLGSVQLIRPGQLNLMTSGRGIAHAENSITPPGPVLHGVQLWIALPSAARAVPASFEHHRELPVVSLGGARARVLIGSFGPARSPAQVHSPLVAADLTVSGAAQLPLRADWEYAALLTGGAVELDGRRCDHREMVYLGSGRERLDVQPAEAGARLLLIGGQPLEERLVMWWNFVATDHDEIVAAREEWQAGSARFGSVTGGGTRLPAPPMPPLRLVPRGRT